MAGRDYSEELFGAGPGRDFSSELFGEEAEKKSGAFVSGFKSYAPQLQETFGGVKTLAGVAAERMFGAGDVSKGLIASGGASMAEAQKAQESLATPERGSFSDALSKGVGSVLTEWLPFQAGSGAANILESLAVVGAGALAGSATAPGPGTAIGLGTGLVAKEIVKRGIKEAAEKVLKEQGEEASKAFFEQEARKAAVDVATRVGQTSALGAQAGFYGTGQTTSRAVEAAEAEGKTASDIELARVLPASVVSAGAEFIGDKIGLSALSGVAKPGSGYLANIAKNILMTGTKEAPVEVVQSMAERFGAKLSLADAAAVKEYIDSAAAAYGTSVAPGTVGGVRGTMQQRTDSAIAGQLPGETVEQSITRLQQEILAGTQPPPPPPAPPVDIVSMISEPGGYGAVEKVKQVLMSQEQTEPIKRQIADITELQARYNIEEQERLKPGATYESAFAMTPPPKPPITIIDDTVARTLGFVPTKAGQGIYNQIIDSDLTDPDQLSSVRTTLEQYIVKGKGAETTRAKVQSFLNTLPQGTTDVVAPVSPPSGTSTGVVSEPVTGAAPGVAGVAEPTGVVYPVPDAGVALGGEAGAPAAVAPTTELVSEVSAPVAEAPEPIAPPSPATQVPQSDLSGTAVGGAPAVAEAAVEEAVAEEVVPFTTKPPGVGPAITEQQDYEQAIVQANKAARAVERKSKSLWGALRGVLPMQDVNDISPDRKFRMLGNARRGTSLSTIVADGAVDDFLPPDMRHDVDTFDEYDSTEYIKDRLREGSYLTFDAQNEILQIGSTIAELEDAIDALLKEKEVNDLIQDAIDEQAGTVEEAQAIEPSDEAAVAGAVPTEQAEPAVTPKPAAPVQYRIVKTEVSSEDGGSKSAWNVTDKADGYVFDTFDTRKEAQDHVNRIKAPKKSLADVPEKRLLELERRAKAAREAPATEAEPEQVTQQISPEIQLKMKQLQGLLKTLMNRFGLKDVGLNLVNDLAANGEYSNNLIKLAIDAVSPVRDLRHESLHALKELGFFTPQQWAVLEKKAQDTWINQFLKQRNINGGELKTGEKSRYDAYVEMFTSDNMSPEAMQEALIEEAISDAFGEFDVNKAPVGMMQAILKRMRTFFAVVKESLGQAKIETAEDIFGKVEAGKLKGEAKPEAKEAKASLRAPQTEAFNRWFGDSKIVDEDGNPKVMYHGTAKDYGVIGTGRRQARAIFLTDEPGFAEKFSKDTFARAASKAEQILSPEQIKKARAEAVAAIRKDYRSRPEGGVMIESIKGGYDDATAEAQEYLRNAYKNYLPAGPNIMPLFVRAENPFDHENKDHIAAIEQYEKDNRYTDKSISNFVGDIKRGSWEAIEDRRVQDAIKSLGHDAFYVMEDGKKSLAVYESNQLKSATGNIGTYDINNPDIRYSLRSRVPPSTWAAIERVTTARDELTFVERITKAIAPESFSKFRAQALNRYNQLSVYDKMIAKKMGGAQLMADRSAESAALMSDLGAGVVAASMGVHDRVGGIPVYKNGFTTVSNVNNTVKGIIAIFSPLAKYNDPDIYRAFQFWAGSKRGSRFLANGTEHLYTQGDMQEARKLLAQHPEFENIFKDWTKYNEGLVQYMVDTGVISAANGKKFIEYSDYIPFYRQLDGERTVGPNIFQSIAGVKAPKKIKGGDAPLSDFLETIVMNTQSAIQAGMKNVAGQRAVNMAVDIGTATALPVVSSAPNVVTVLQNGLKVSYEVDDPLFIDAVKSLNLPDLPFLGILSAPANLLRNLVTKDPGFMLVNMMRDSLSAYVTSGTDMKPVIATAMNFGKVLANKSPEYAAMLNAGILGGYDYSAGVEASAQQLNKELRKSAKVSSTAEKIFKPATWLWDALEKGTQASDAATRIEVYKDTLAKTNNEAEALFRAVEVMNFNRKGSSAVIRIATAAIPFLNARMQGLDVLYRSGVSPFFDKNATDREKAIQKNFFIRGATIAALSGMYWLLTHDEEEYKKQEQETRDNYWLFPSLGIKIAIPFEVGIIFKVIPERILQYSFGNDTGEVFLGAMKRNLQNTLPITLTGMIPQVAKPYLESQMNYSLFTNRAILSQGMESVVPKYQALPSTSTIFKDLGEQLNVSPVKLEYMWRGYTGTIGSYVADAVDSVWNLHKDAPKAAKRFEQLPVIKRFALDPDARGSVTAFFELKNATETAVRTANLLERSQEPEKFIAYMQENAGLFASKEYVQEIAKTLDDLNDAKNMVRSAPMDPVAKRDLLLDIARIENNLTANVFAVRKMIEK